MAVQYPDAIKVVVLGRNGVGKSALVIQFVNGTYYENFDADIEDSYRKNCEVPGTQDLVMMEVLDTASTSHFPAMREMYLTHGEVFLLLVPLGGPDNYRADEDAVVADAKQIRQVKKLAPTAATPAILVGTKADLLTPPDRTVQLIALAARLQVWAYCEVSAKSATNVAALFKEVIVRALKEKGGRPEPPLGLKAVLPWNWSKSKPKYVASTRRLEYLSLPFNVVPDHLTEEAIDEFRFPEPKLTRSPVAFFADIRRLLEEEAGRALADVALTVPDSTECVRAHAVVLFLRSDYLREKLSHGRVERIVVQGVTLDTLQHVVHYLYTDEVPPSLTPAALDQLGDAAMSLSLLDLAALVRGHTTDKPQRALASSEAVERQTKPCMSTPAFKTLSDIEVMVSDSKQVFRLHRAVLWARSEWFRALIDRWSRNNASTAAPMELSVMSGDVLACVVEYLYTGRATVPAEIAIDVLAAANMINLPRLVHIAEFALQAVVASSVENAVAVYLAAEAHGASELMAMCEHHMAMSLAKAERSEQWAELSDVVKERARSGHARLVAERAHMRELCFSRRSGKLRAQRARSHHLRQ